MQEPLYETSASMKQTVITSQLLFRQVLGGIFMCYQCDEISKTIKIINPNEYISIVEQAKNFVVGGILILLNGTCSLDEIGKGKPWPDDIIRHMFKCTDCGRVFTLGVETYHGSGGEWSVVIE